MRQPRTAAFLAGIACCLIMTRSVDVGGAERSPDLGPYVSSGGRLDIESLRSSGYQGPLDMAGYAVTMDPDGGAPLVRSETADSSGNGEFWSEEFGISGMNDPVRALLMWGSDLVAAGDFTVAGSTSAIRIARWDGSLWHLFDTPGFTGGEVLAMTLTNDTLVVGGSFTSPAGHVAMWPGGISGGPWEGMGGGLSGSVYALAVYQGRIHAGGSFPGMLSRWDAGTWSTVGGGVTSGASVRSLTPYLSASSDLLMIGGSFTAIGGITAHNIAGWNGTTGLFSSLGGGLNGTVYALEARGTSLFAGGGFTLEDGTAGPPLRGVAVWTGAWGPLGDGVNGTVYSVEFYQNRLYAGGLFAYNGGGLPVRNIARWNSIQWVGLDSGTNAEVDVLVSTSDTLYVGGAFTEVGPAASRLGANYIAQWDGSVWSVFEGDGMQTRVQALALYNSNVVAGGNFLFAGGLLVNYIAEWDGQTWDALGGGMSTSQTGEVAALTLFRGKLAAGGTFARAGGTLVNNVALWNGFMWESLDDGLFNGQPVVSSLVAWPDGGQTYLVAGGGFDRDVHGRQRNFIAKYDDVTASWLPVGSGLADTVRALTLHNADLVAGGDFLGTWDGATTLNHVGVWNGTSWNALSLSLDGTVRALDSLNGHLIAGGDFLNPVPYLARWDAPDWVALGELDGAVYSLAHRGNALTVGGNFTAVNAQLAANRIAVWYEDSGTWEALEGGLNNTVRAVELMEGQLFTGGDFTRADGNVSYFFGERIVPVVVAAPEPEPELEPGSRLRCAPNPFRRATRVQFDLPAAARVRLSILDVQGRRIRGLADQLFPSGPADIVWDGRTESGDHAKPGVYFVQLRTGDATTSRKVVRIH